MSREKEYNEYINTHVRNVIESWKRFLKPALLFYMDKIGISVDDIKKVQMAIKSHDASKWSEEQYSGYLHYFYPEAGADLKQAEKEMDYAWLHHQNTNPHHWQYYVLIRDNSKATLLDIPFEYICEMLCDWHSFSKKDPTSTAANWYSKNKDKMMLSDNTRQVVEKLLTYMTKPLAQDNK